MNEAAAKKQPEPMAFSRELSKRVTDMRCREPIHLYRAIGTHWEIGVQKNVGAGQLRVESMELHPDGVVMRVQHQHSRQTLLIPYGNIAYVVLEE